jgi:hypothetical protein
MHASHIRFQRTPQQRRHVFGVVFLLLSACAASHPRSQPPGRSTDRGATPPQAAKADRPSPPKSARKASGGDDFEEQEIGETAELKPPVGSETLLPEPDVTVPPTPAEPGSLLAQVSAATPPNVAAAIRLIEEGRKQRDQGHYDQALEALERAVAIDPTNAYGYYFLAQVHYLKKNYDQAIAFASRAATLSARTDPTCLGRVYSLQGAAFEEVGRYPDARKAYKHAVDADPNNLAARVGVARLAEPRESSAP